MRKMILVGLLAGLGACSSPEVACFEVRETVPGLAPVDHVVCDAIGRELADPKETESFASELPA